MKPWKQFVNKVKNPEKSVRIALIGKYVELPDSYKSIMESFVHAGAVNDCKVDLKSIQSEKLNEENIEKSLPAYRAYLLHRVLVTGE
jgi:CTP synthase